MSTRTDAVDRLALTWRTDAAPDAVALSRLDGLSHTLAAQGLPTGLLPHLPPDELVCVRRVELPAYRVAWASDDTELVAGWGRVAAGAVSDAVAAGGDGVVRYRSREHARRDLVASLLRGDRARLWAWRAVEVWPGSGAAAAADAPLEQVLAAVLTASAFEAPHAGAGLVADLARAGLLPRCVAAAPEPLLVQLAAQAWRSATGAPWPPAGLPVVAGPGRAGAPPLPGVNGGVRPPGASEWAWAAASVVVRALRGVAVGGAERPDGAAVALAALAVLDLDPGPALGPHAGRLVAAVAAWLAGVGSTPPDSRDAAPPGTLRAPDPHAPAGPAQADPAQAPRLGSRAPAPPQAGSSTVQAAGTAMGSATATDGTATTGAARTSGDGCPAVASGTASGEAAPTSDGRDGGTRWGGLMFLLPLVAESGLPGVVARDPDAFGPQLRPVLHALGLRILHRATAASGEAAPSPQDPAALAFAGLAPGAAAPPAPPGADGLDPVVDGVVTLLRSRLPAAPRPDGDPDGSELLAGICRRAASIAADPGWIDVLLELDEVDVDVRRAGLDLDPGYLPWLGCVVRFRYG